MASEAPTPVAPVAADADALRVLAELDDDTVIVIVRRVRTADRSSGQRARGIAVPHRPLTGPHK
ncbi:hypothetical protein ABT126_07310 [Streptomyces sp. NPDC002012]|uniref:hypothetical protein n=1 Tax=unclassified Streptomyces TaxID=2593676 RepID=UPI002E126D89|nr:hypothetical protein OG609_09270 [Streptomyces sp. NBC_01224]